MSLEAIYPPSYGLDVTPSDSTVLRISRSVYFSEDGTAVLRFADSQSTHSYKVWAGTRLSGQYDMLLSTGTSGVTSAIWEY